MKQCTRYNHYFDLFLADKVFQNEAETVRNVECEVIFMIGKQARHDNV